MPRYDQLMDVCVLEYMEKICQRHDRKFRYAYRPVGPKITEQHRENTTKDDGSYF